MPFYTNRRGKRLYYEEYGSGEVFVWIHPPGMGRKVFLQQHNLARHGRMIFPDLSGNGDSETVTKAPDISFYAREMVELLNYLDVDEAIIAGYSCGGMVAQELALSFPNRVKGLILAGGFPKVDTGFLHFEFAVGMEWIKKSPESLAKLLSHSHFHDADIKRELNEHMAKSDPEVWYQFYNHGHRYDCSGRLKSLRMPVLVVYGRKEYWINHHEFYYRDCSDMTLAYIEKATHQTPATHGPVFNHIVLEFVRNKKLT